MSGQHLLLCLYRYDPLDRLSGQAPASEADVRFFYREHRQATQLQGVLRVSFLQADEQVPALQRMSGASVHGTLLAADRQQSLLQAVQAVQATGQQAVSYTPYGHRTPVAGLDGLPGFNGECRDPLTGHYLLGNGYRAFNPVLMRFNSADNLSPFGAGGLNGYAYCQADPINGRDPTGHLRVAKGAGKFFLAVSPSRVQSGRVAPRRPVMQVRPMIEGRLVAGPAASPQPVVNPVAATIPAAIPAAPRTTSQIATGSGAAFSFYEPGYLRSLNDQQYVAAAFANIGALNEYLGRHGPRVAEFLEQSERMLLYMQQFVRGMPTRGVSPQVLGGNRDYLRWVQSRLDSVRQARTSLYP